MLLAAKTTLTKIADATLYGDAARVNAALIRESGSRVPCYAIKGKRTRVRWVSVGSSAVVGRGVAADFLRRVGVDINEVEAA